MNNVRPQLRLLNEEQIRQVHGYALRILSETGVRVDSSSVAGRLGRTGQVEIQGRTVKLSPSLVEDAIRSAPASIQMYDRRAVQFSVWAMTGCVSASASRRFITRNR